MATVSNKTMSMGCVRCLLYRIIEVFDDLDLGFAGTLHRCTEADDQAVNINRVTDSNSGGQKGETPDEAS